MSDAPKILGTDKLKDAYPKMNQVIDMTNNFQTQINQIVVEGSIDPETAQARVKADGTAYTTLRDRLNDTDSQLADNAKKLIDYVNVKELGAIGDGVTDDTEIIQSAFDTYDNVYIPPGIYKITSTLTFKGNSIFYGNGYRGRNLLMDRKALLQVFADVDLLVVKGSHMKISGGTLSCEPVMNTYSKTLFKMTAFDSDKAIGANITCNNVIDSLYCVNGKVFDLPDFTGTGIHLINDGANAMYSNRFVNCYVADLGTGLKIENNSTAGINGNYFDMSIWNCNNLAYVKGSGNVFTGNCQSGKPGTDSEKPAFDVFNGYNHFLWMVWDVGQYPVTNKYAYRFNGTATENVVLQYHPTSVIIGNNYPQKLNTSETKNNAYLINPAYAGGTRNGIKQSAYLASPANNGLANRKLVNSITATTTNFTAYGLTDYLQLANHNKINRAMFSKVDSALEASVTFTIALNEPNTAYSCMKMIGLYSADPEQGLANGTVTITGRLKDNTTVTFKEKEIRSSVFVKVLYREFYLETTPSNIFNNGLKTLTITITVPASTTGNAAIVSLNYLYGLFYDLYYGHGFMSGVPSTLGDTMYGDLTFGTNIGTVLTSPNGSKYRLKVDDAGVLSTVKI